MRSAAAFAAGSALPRARAAKKATKFIVYVGTYTGPKSKGVYAYHFDAVSGDLQPIGLAGEVLSPSWITIHPNGKVLYAASGAGQVSEIWAFSINAGTGALTKLNSVPTGGGGRCHLVVDKTGKTIMVANYNSGHVAALPLQPDGSVGQPPVVIAHHGSGPDPRRQRVPHPHGVFLSADNRFLFVPDLGTDQVMSYRLDAAKSSIAPNDPPFATVPPAHGPRHLAFDPKGKFAYVVNEMKSTVTGFSYDAKHGTMQQIQDVSTLPKDFTRVDNSAEIQIDAKGRFLYASNRGHDSITVFAIGKDGQLTTVDNTLTQGKEPRNFSLDPTGAYLFAANQNTGNIVLFRVDAQTGKLSPAGKSVEVAAPVCLQFLAV